MQDYEKLADNFRVTFDNGMKGLKNRNINRIDYPNAGIISCRVITLQIWACCYSFLELN